MRNQHAITQCTGEHAPDRQELHTLRTELDVLRSMLLEVLARDQQSERRKPLTGVETEVNYRDYVLENSLHGIHRPFEAIKASTCEHEMRMLRQVWRCMPPENPSWTAFMIRFVDRQPGGRASCDIVKKHYLDRHLLPRLPHGRRNLYRQDPEAKPALPPRWQLPAALGLEQPATLSGARSNPLVSEPTPKCAMVSKCN